MITNYPPKLSSPIHRIPMMRAGGSWPISSHRGLRGLSRTPTNSSDPRSAVIANLALPEPGKPTSYRFEGNRIELVAPGPLNGRVKVLVDGKTPEELDGCWLNSRVSRLPNVPDWPAIARVWVDPGYHKADHWTVRVARLNAEQDSFDFALDSASGGPDGNGRATEPFVSRSGRVKIEPSAWLLAYAQKTSRKPVPEGSLFSWDRNFICTDEPAVTLPDGHVELRHVLATGLANGPHFVKLTIDPDAPAITEVRTYRPPLTLLNGWKFRAAD